MEPFDIVRNPLTDGSCLIEAGAGTGKTYALTAIFLRLLLDKHIEPDRILIVTFTTAATAELRDRLRRQLMAVRLFIDGQGPLDGTLRDLVERFGPVARSRERVVAALREFDRTAIFTIHGFCQRLLTEMAFETGSPFTLELLPEASAWIQSAAEDYWREVFHDAPPELAAHALGRIGGPEPLARQYERFRIPDLRIIPVARQRPRIDFEPYRRGCAKLYRQWPAARAAIAAALESPALKGNVYGSLKPLSGGAPHTTQRKQKVAAWCRALDFFLRRERAPFPPCPSLIYFSSAKIAAATRKGQSPPAHPFLDDCQALSDTARELQTSLEEWVTALRYGFFVYADRKLERQKQERQTLFYDDLLTRAAKALQGERGRRLAAAVRRRYHAALVDEFQDTDSTQYEIFQTLFGTAERLLVMIGDPKQAIYGFRGADIFSYLKASGQSRHRFTLLQNWRSRPALIQAVNTLFESRPNPFLIDEIAYRPAVAAPTHVGGDRQLPGRAPMTFWLMTHDGAGDGRTAGRLTKAQATEKILAAITVEVGRLLQTSAAGAPSAAECAPGDIAILVRTNRQARQVKACMAAAGIPAVVHNAGNVFDTPEADDLGYVLRAVAQPGDHRGLKTALATRFFGWRGEQLAFEAPAPPNWEVMAQRFGHYHAIWQDIGFFPFFRRLLAENRVPERLLRLADGERRLTNLLHLGELLNQMATQQRTGLQGTLKWMDEQRSALSGSLEEQQLRLESDAQAVTILTIHKSKGLEYPIVFCPFCWESDADRRDWPLFHDPAADWRRTLDIGAPAAADHLKQAQTERRAESLRLLYVAVTRAREHCYLVWGALPSAENSALGYLLYGDLGNDAAGRSDSPLDRSERPEGSPIDEAAAALDRLVRASGDTIAAEPLPESAPTRDQFAAPAQTLQAERAMHRRFDPHWTIASFSALARPVETDDQGIGDRHHDPTILPLAPIGSADREAGPKLADNIHLFPGGAHAGNFFHRLFEILDFDRLEPQQLKNCVAIELDRFGFDRQWISPVTNRIADVLATALTSETPPLCLNRLGPEDCVKELPFCFPLKRTNAEALRQFYIRQDLPLPLGDVDRQLKKLNFIISGGYLRGFVDLVFRFQGRYFLLDWKSNLLGAVYADYGSDRIRAVMTESYYFLQYHLYALALERFLRMRLADYAYETHFGGVFYLFIRGMQPDHGHANGVFFDRPAARLLQELGRLLVDTTP